jgi:peroxiredoxin Q/BCP
MLDVGTRAPDFALPDERGNEVSSSDHRGHWVVLWWYPKAATPG